MTQLPLPQAKRLRPPSWKDSRLLIGVALVLASIVLGATAFSALDQRQGMWVAKGEMVPGDRVTEDDLMRVDMQLGEATSDYLRASDGLPQDAVVDRPLREGELVPRDALIAPGSLDVMPVPIHVDPIYLADLAKGSRVSVYAAETEAPAEGESSAASDDELEYRLILERVTISSIPESSGRVLGGGSSAEAVTILVPDDEVERIVSMSSVDRPFKLVAEGGSAQGQG